MKRIGPTKRQKTAKQQTTSESVVPLKLIVVEQSEIPPTSDNNPITQLQTRIQFLEKQLQGIGVMAGESAARAAGEAVSEVEAMLNARCSELFAHILALKEQLVLLAKKTTKWCVVCFEKENTYAFMPCRHKCVCKDCAKRTYERFKKCPICRQSVTSAKAIYDLSAMDTQ